METEGMVIHFPELEDIKQGREYFIVDRDGVKEKIRFHDYDKIYEIPGLYEHLFYERYQCNSPEVVCSLLQEQIGDPGQDTEALSVLDIGAGNGMVAEQLVGMGAESIVGIDIIEEAREAAVRDRPGLYEDYHVVDLTNLPTDVDRSLQRRDFNCMTVVAALGFDDIPPQAFAAGYNYICPNGWVAFNIKEDFIDTQDCTGFRCLIERITDADLFDIQVRHRYRHRLCQDGRPLFYWAVIGRKLEDIPDNMLAGLA